MQRPRAVDDLLELGGALHDKDALNAHLQGEQAEVDKLGVFVAIAYEIGFGALNELWVAYADSAVLKL